MTTGTWDYDGPDPNKPEEWNTSDGLGLAGPVPSAFGGPNGEPVPPDPNDPDAGSNSGSGGGPYGQATRNDHKPLDAFGTSANAGADATDASADVNVTRGQQRRQQLICRSCRNRRGPRPPVPRRSSRNPGHHREVPAQKRRHRGKLRSHRASPRQPRRRQRRQQRQRQ